MMVDEYVRRRDDIIKTLRANGLASSENEARRAAEGMLATEVSVQKNFDKQKDQNTFGFKMKEPSGPRGQTMVEMALDNVVGPKSTNFTSGDSVFKVPSTPAKQEIKPQIKPELKPIAEDENASPIDRGEMFKFD